jgi:hypothetical protein
MTCCAIDDPGSDTTTAVASWLEQYKTIRVAACVGPRQVSTDGAARLLTIEPRSLTELAAFARLVASLLRPGGILLQDVHLSTLRFIPADRWWESIYIAATVRGTFARRPPAVRFLSNKRGYTATFGRDLMQAGFDPREVMDKAELEAVIVPSIARSLRTQFPFELTSSDRPGALPVSADEDDRREIDEGLDVVLWDPGGRIELSGRSTSAPVTFRAGSQEARTWQLLIADRIQNGPGLLIASVGERLAESGAERAEMSNLAARHVHGLRSRLLDGQAILTVNHAYRLDPSLVVGLVRKRDDRTSGDLRSAAEYN